MKPERARRPATYADLEGVPPHRVAEIIDGELIASPRPAPRHARVASRLGGHLDGPFDRGTRGPGGWLILDEPELHLLGHVLVPNLAGWRRERLAAPPDVAYFEAAPDCVCEVLSASTVADDRERKLPIYAEARVGHAWLIDPLVQTLEIFRLEGGAWRFVGAFSGQRTIEPEPFGAVSLDLATLWEW